MDKPENHTAKENATIESEMETNREAQADTQEMDMENIIFEIIANAGNAKGIVYEAIAKSQKGECDEALAMLKEADTYLLKAHKVQTDILTDEAGGKHHEVSVLFVHAQDHLMSAVEVRTLAENLIETNRQIHELAKRIG